MTATTDEWSEILRDHPIFSLPDDPSPTSRSHLELSAETLLDGDSSTTRRKRVMVLKDSDVIVAAGNKLRMSSVGDVKLSSSTRKSYKTLHTPNITFNIHQIVVNPSGKLLAVAGETQVSIVVLPRPGYNRLVPPMIGCKSIQVGQFYHSEKSSAPIAKIDWHPWGEAGSTLLVMTIDGKLREYDISVDTDEPQQTLSFVPERKANTFTVEDDSDRHVMSFTLGQGRADWGPLTVYVVMRSGDIYSICPYLPRNAAIPSSYIHSLECFISAKQEFLLHSSSGLTQNLSHIYDYQRKYVNALVKQLPAGTVFPAVSRSVVIHPPTTIKAPPLRQGPFLLQPAPRTLDGIDVGDATDIIYLAFGTDDDEPDVPRDTEHLGTVLVSYQDGRIDLFLDVEKVEARWDVKHKSSHELPMLAVYETIDLGLLSSLADLATSRGPTPPTTLLRGNHPVFLPDPLHDDMVYVYHAFGVHALDISPVLRGLSAGLKSEEDEATLRAKLNEPIMTNVRHLLSTLSVERRASNPVVAVAIPNDVYVSYTMCIMTSRMRITTFPLTLRTVSHSQKKGASESSLDDNVSNSLNNQWMAPAKGVSTYISLLGNSPYEPPTIASNPSGLPANPKLSLPVQPASSKEFILTPDTLRFIGKNVAHISAQVADIQIAYNAAMARMSLQKTELARLISKCKDMEALVQTLKGKGKAETDARIAKVQGEQKKLLARFDRLLQALMDKASPELNEHESKWFEELNRMKRDVVGSANYDEDSFMARVRQLEREYARIMPSLETLATREQSVNQKSPEDGHDLGLLQATEYKSRSKYDNSRISALEKEISKLALQVDLPVAQPPQRNRTLS